MSLPPYTAGLHQVAPDTYAYLQPPGTWGWNNCGLVVSGREALLVDTTYTLGLTTRLLETIELALPGVEITTLAFTHGNGDHCNGNQLLRDAEIICSEATAKELLTEISAAEMTAMMRLPVETPMGAYMRRYFNEFDWTGIESTPPTRTFSGRLAITVGDRHPLLVEAGPAHTGGDTFVHVPDTQVCYAGDLLFVGDHPVMWSGPVDGWVAACDQILATGATVIVPGHGPVTGRAGVAEFRDYLLHVAAWAAKQFEAGVPFDVAAATLPLSGYEHWGLPERLYATMGAIYADLGKPVPGGRATLIRGMAERAQELLGR